MVSDGNVCADSVSTRSKHPATSWAIMTAHHVLPMHDLWRASQQLGDARHKVERARPRASAPATAQQRSGDWSPPGSPGR